jgi:hypothetical protein
MQQEPLRPVPAAAPQPARSRRLARGVAFAFGLAAAASSHAIDFGPFSLTGWVKAGVAVASDVCEKCQRDPEASRQFIWADDLVYGKKFGSELSHSWQFQPTLSVKFDLPRGFKLSGEISQRFRDGDLDLPGALYSRNVALKHEDYGTLQVGKFVTRGWNRADFPYASDVGQTAFSDSGAAYGINTNAIRYTTRELDVFEGNLVLEATYDRGDWSFKRNKPSFVEVWALYGKGPLLVEGVVQVTKNGSAGAFAKAPFTGLTPFGGRDDDQLGGNAQAMVLLLAKYQIGTAYELSGGIRHNRWSGAYAVPVTEGVLAQWNNPFNVDWGGFDENGVPNPGYAARSTDLMLGARKYINRQWVGYLGSTYLGKARTDNPRDRGQDNWALIGTLGAKYTHNESLSFSGSVNAVFYGRKGLAPLSMPAHSSFSNIDSRLAKRGNWVTFEANYDF